MAVPRLTDTESTFVRARKDAHFILMCSQSVRLEHMRRIW
jgi:hypothetical protein